MTNKGVKNQKQYPKGKIICVSNDAHKKLTDLKVHPNQPYAEVVDELLKIEKKWIVLKAYSL